MPVSYITISADIPTSIYVFH